MNISLITHPSTDSTESRIMINLVDEMKKLGMRFDVNKIYSDTKALLSNSIIMTGPTLDFVSEFPNLPLVCYNWDTYPWTLYNLRKYGELLQKAQSILCPSYSVARRVEEFYKLGYKTNVLRTYVDMYEIPYDEIQQSGFVYHPVREYQDAQLRWTDKACEELGIPLVRPNHSLSRDEYRQTVASANVIVTEYEEASTGGLTLVEGFFNGKSILACDSPYLGINDYLEDQITYFRRGNYEDFKEKLAQIYFRSEKISKEELDERREFCEKFRKRNFCIALKHHFIEVIYKHGAKIQIPG